MTTPFPFVAAQVLTAQELNSITNLPSSTKTVSYVLTIANLGSRVVMNAAGSTTITANTSIFSAGDVVELSNIGAGTCTLTAGTATVSSAGPLAIPQYGGGRLVFTSASAAIYFPSAVTVASSAVVQIKSTTLTSTFSGTASLGTFLDITGLSISITPTSASNKILVFAEVAASTASGVGTVTAILTGGNCASYRGDADQTRQRAAVSQTYPLDRAPCTMNLLYLDSPATTSATIYGVGLNYGNNSGATDTVYCNRGYTDTNNTYTVRTASTITVMEVAP